MTLAVEAPLLVLWGCSRTLAWAFLKSGELLFAWGPLVGLDFLGVSEQEDTEGSDLSISSAVSFRSPVNFQLVRLWSLSLGWARVLLVQSQDLAAWGKGGREKGGKLPS